MTLTPFLKLNEDPYLIELVGDKTNPGLPCSFRLGAACIPGPGITAGIPHKPSSKALKLELKIGKESPKQRFGATG